MGTEDDDFSIANEIPAPMVIRRFRYLHKLWRNPVAQRHLWQQLKWLNYKKYTEDPDLYRRRLDRNTKWSFPAGVLIAGIIYGSQFVPQFVNPQYLILGVQSLVVLGILITLIVRSLRKGPIGRFSPLHVHVHDMFDSSKPDMVLTAPITDSDEITSIVFSYQAAMIVQLVNFFITFFGLIGGLLLIMAILRIVGANTEYVYVLLAFMAGLVIVILPILWIISMAGQFLIAGLAIKMNYQAAQVLGSMVIAGSIMGSFIGVPMLFTTGIGSSITAIVIVFIVYATIIAIIAWACHGYMVYQFGLRRQGQ